MRQLVILSSIYLLITASASGVVWTETFDDGVGRFDITTGQGDSEFAHDPIDGNLDCHFVRKDTGDGNMTLAVSTSSDVQDMAANGLASSVTSSAVTIDNAGVCTADFDQDGDVDENDFDHFTACFSGPAVPQENPSCLNADFDDDLDVDQADFGLFQRCLSGTDVPGDPGCEYGN